MVTSCRSLSAFIISSLSPEVGSRKSMVPGPSPQSVIPLGIFSVVRNVWIPVFNTTHRPEPEAAFNADCIESPGFTMIASAGILGAGPAPAPATYPIGPAFGEPEFRGVLPVGKRTEVKMLRLAFDRMESAALLVNGRSIRWAAYCR